MAFQLKADESVRAGLLRVTARELARAQTELRSEGREDDAIHEIRKSLKRTRAVLRLVREELGNATYHRENFACRDAARPLTELREAAVFVETLDGLTATLGGEREAAAFAEVREALVRRQRAVAKRVLANGRAFARVAKALEGSQARLPAWPIERDHWLALQAGLGRVYREGRRARAAAAKKPSVELLHEWRKQSKYLWHQLQLLEPAWRSAERELGEQAHQLSVLLGEDHDLAVLRRLVKAAPASYGGRRAVGPLLPLIDRRRRALQQEAFALGERLYRDPTTLFKKRLARYWKRWRATARGPQLVADGRRPTRRVRMRGGD